jgi:tRNA1(Val) A37 N6-methylase TrmN6
MERLEDLQLENLKIYQDDALYTFTSDSVLLSRFATVKKNDVVADFCAGSGIVGLHLYGLNKDKVQSVTLFEMQPALYELSKKTITYNNLEHVFSAINTKVQQIDNSYFNKFSPELTFYVSCNLIIQIMMYKQFSSFVRTCK